MDGFIAFANQWLPEWYIWIGIAYGALHLGLALFRDFVLLFQLARKVAWNTAVIPFVMGLLWPVSMALHVAHNLVDLRRFWFFRELYGSHLEEDEEEILLDDKYERMRRKKGHKEHS